MLTSPASVVAGLVLLTFSAKGMALDLDVRSSTSNALDFSLLVEHSVADFKRNGEKLEANVERIGILTIDVPRHGPRFGLALGYAFGDFDNNGLYRSISMDGYYLGVSVQGDVIDAGSFSLTAHAGYIFQDVDGADINNNTASLSWHEYAVGLSFKYAVTNALHIVVEPVFADINATYRERGVTSQTVKLDSTHGGGVQTEMQYWLNDRESVSVQYRDSVLHGFVFRFRRIF